jgi:hypothetical protein
MADVALTIVGGLACLASTCAVAMWLVPRFVRRTPMLRRVGARIRSQGAIHRMISWVGAFPSAREAIMCAIDIQRALARRPAAGELPIRGTYTLARRSIALGDFYGFSIILGALIADRATLVRSRVLTGQGADRSGRRRRAQGSQEEVDLTGLDGRHRLYRIA